MGCKVSLLMETQVEDEMEAGPIQRLHRDFRNFN